MPSPAPPPATTAAPNASAAKPSTGYASPAPEPRLPRNPPGSGEDGRKIGAAGRRDRDVRSDHRVKAPTAGAQEERSRDEVHADDLQQPGGLGGRGPAR